MPKFIISNQTSGQCLGEYEGIDEKAALDAMAKDAGYSSYLQALDVCGLTDDLIVEETNQ